MSDTLDEDHAQVVLARLDANANIVNVFDGAVTNPTPPLPYVLVYTALDWPEDGAANTVNQYSLTAVATWHCHCVGEGAAAARAVAMEVRSTLLNVQPGPTNLPAVTGRSCGLIRLVDSPPPQRDESTGRVVFDKVLVFSMLSTG